MEVPKLELPDDETLKDIDPLQLIELQSQINDFVTFLNGSILSEEVSDE